MRRPRFLFGLFGSSKTRTASVPVVEQPIEEPQKPIGETNMSITKEKLEIIAGAVQTVETLAATAVAQTGTTPTAQQKLNAAVAIATAVDPELAPRVTLVQSIISSLVGVFNIFGIFKKKLPAQPAPVAVPAPQAQQ
jgi:hypothetical protein